MPSNGAITTLLASHGQIEFPYSRHIERIQTAVVLCLGLLRIIYAHWWQCLLVCLRCGALFTAFYASTNTTERISDESGLERCWGYKERPSSVTCYPQERTVILLSDVLGHRGVDQFYAHHWPLVNFKLLTGGGLGFRWIADAVGGNYGLPGRERCSVAALKDAPTGDRQRLEAHHSRRRFWLPPAPGCVVGRRFPVSSRLRLHLIMGSVAPRCGRARCRLRWSGRPK